MEADADPGYGSALVVITVMQLKTFWSTSSWRERVDSLRSDREMSASKLTTRSEIVIIDQ